MTYSLANTGCVVIISRLLSGFASTMGEVFETSYIGEVGTQVEKFKKKGGKNSRLKDVLYVIFAFASSGAIIFCFGKTKQSIELNILLHYIQYSIPALTSDNQKHYLSL